MKPTPAAKGKGHAVNVAQTKKHPSKSVSANSRGKLRAAQVAAPGSRAAVAAMQRERDRQAYLQAPKECTPPERRARLLRLLRDMRGNDADTQARRVLLALEGGPATTVELRKFLDVMMVSSRIHELRSAGHDIATIWVRQQTDAGQWHRVALYVLSRRAR